jgi:hypothetical protein
LAAKGEGWRAFGVPSPGGEPIEMIRKASRVLAIAAIPRDVVDTIASEMANGVERAVDYWMSQVERALTDPGLTTLGRMNAVREVIDRYKKLTGKEELECRRDQLPAWLRKAV